MGVEFVKELINTHFRMTPFKIRAQELFEKQGHQEFFLVDRFGLGCPLGQLFWRVEVLITSLHHNMADILQPLMAIGNTECVIELTAPNALVVSRSYDQEEIMATSEQLLDAMSLNLRRMRLKGYCVLVRYQGKIIFVANKRDDEPKVGRNALSSHGTTTNQTMKGKRSRATSNHSLGSIIKRQKVQMKPGNATKSSQTQGGVTSRERSVVHTSYNTAVGRKPMRPRMYWENNCNERSDEDCDDGPH
jgi:hypothetical protein